VNILYSVEHGVFSSGRSAADRDTNPFHFALYSAKNKKTAMTRGLRN
jgi:hypothetical protein